MAYDSARERVILYGGSTIDPDDIIFYDDTWEYDGTDWTEVTTAHSPPAKMVRTMAFDSTRDRTVLAIDPGSGPSAETWEYDGTDWTKLSPTHAPPWVGVSGAMAFDSEHGVAVLVVEEMDSVSRTWTWDGADWTAVSCPQAPLARTGHGLAFDSARSRLVLFGGESSYDPNGYVADTWEFDGSGWEQLDPPHIAVDESEISMAFDSLRQRTVLYSTWGTFELGVTTEVLHENGVASGGCCSEMTGHSLAEDVELTAPKRWTAGRFEMDDGTGTFPSNWDWTLQYSIHADDAGIPGVALTSGSGYIISSGIAEGDHYLFTFDIDPPFDALPNETYWLALHMASDWDTEDNLLWSLTDEIHGVTARVNDGPGTDWSDSGHHLAFTLYGEAGLIFNYGFESGGFGYWIVVQ